VLTLGLTSLYLIRREEMIISLAEIINTRNKSEQFIVPVEMEKFEYNGGSYEFARKDPVNLTVTNIGDKKVLIEASTKLALIVYCSRCLKELQYPMDISVTKDIDFNLSDEDRIKNLDETSYISGYNLDVDILIRNEIIVGFPMKVLCSEDCKGICIHCGANLNETSCDCDDTVLDPRMSVIRDIFNKFKEV